MTTPATFSPLDWQIAPWRDQSPCVLLTGSAGGGKSRLAAEKINGFCLRYPGATALVLRKTRESMSNSTVLVLEREVIGSAARHVRSVNRFEYPNGSVLAYGGMKDDEQREQVRSIGLAGGVDIAWMEEATAFSEDDYNEILGRMRGKAASWRQIILTTNPDAPTHWIYKRLIEAGEAHVYYSAATDNRHNPGDYLASLAKLSGALGERLARGRWVQAEGAVYEDWNHALHVVDSFDIPASWRRIRTIDFGYTNPFVCQWWAINDDGAAFLYREIYHTHKLVSDLAAQIKRLSEGERIEQTIADQENAEGRAALAAAGIRNVGAIKDIGAGIQAVQKRLRDGRLFLMRDALVQADDALIDAKLPLCTEHEFPGYTWPKSNDGKPVKEIPVAVNDHGLDAVRYAVMYLDSGALPVGVSGVDPFAGMGMSHQGEITLDRGMSMGGMRFVVDKGEKGKSFTWQ